MMIPQETEFGFYLDHSTVGIFFGKKSANLENLMAQYPQVRWSLINQVHGREVHLTGVDNPGTPRDQRPSADSQITRTKGLALAISTADCVPICLIDPMTGWIGSIHAGWRGVADRVVPATIERLKREGSRTPSLRAWIGPHIQFESFEVDAMVKERLMASAPLVTPKACKPSKDGKFLIDLNALVQAQLDEFQIERDQVFNLGLDTKTDARFHSHRRDRENAGRQISFIFLK